MTSEYTPAELYLLKIQSLFPEPTSSPHTNTSYPSISSRDANTLDRQSQLLLKAFKSFQSSAIKANLNLPTSNCNQFTVRLFVPKQRTSSFPPQHNHRHRTVHVSNTQPRRVSPRFRRRSHHCSTKAVTSPQELAELERLAVLKVPYDRLRLQLEHDRIVADMKRELRERREIA
ncbi:hypothetical protein BDR26DRAFT_863821 [Obelidium mucronatum]|nr:hypothetical protein BDR26DRAFT_863821 [Obelidium mucronatum]